MANYNKSFNFRNGVQIDNDNFVVNANGLVGIGTTIPTDFLDVYGTSKFNSPIRGTDITLSGLTSTKTLRVGIVSITSGIITATSGIVTYYGDGGKLLNLPTSQWADVDSGFGYTSIYSKGNVGIATTYPSYTFQVGSNPDTASGVGFNSTGNITASGNVTAYNFSGFGTNIQGINASNISNGILNNSRLPQNITLGIITASTNFSGTLIGNLTGSVNSSGVSTFSGGISGNLTGSVNSSGVSTFSGGIVGDLTGIANTARSLTGTPNIIVGVVTATTFTTTSGRIGVGTNAPTSDIQIRKASGSLLEVISNSGEARISVGQSVGVGQSSGIIRFGSPSKNFDIINNDTGNLNFYLHGGFDAGINTGRYAWLYGQGNVELASLTYDGNFGIGKTNPATKLYVNGTSTVTGIASFQNNVIVTGTITAGTGDNQILLGSSSGGTLRNFNLNTNSGITTISQLHVFGFTSSVGIGTSIPVAGLDAATKNALFLQVGINTTNTNSTTSLFVNGTSGISDRLGIGTTSPTTADGNLQVYGGKTTLRGNLILLPGISTDNLAYFNQFGLIGIGTDAPAGPLDMRLANLTRSIRGAFYPPIMTTSERIIFTNNAAIPGAIIYNSSTNNHQAWSGTSWEPVGLTSSPNINVGIISATGINVSSGIVTAENGFTSGIGTAVKITTVGNKLIFTVVGVGSTSLTLS